MATIEQRIYDGNRAREVLENEAFAAAFDDIEKDITQQWTTSPARDAEGRERLWTYLMLLRKLKAQLTTTLETGKLAEADLRHQQTLKDRVKAWAGMPS